MAASSEVPPRCVMPGFQRWPRIANKVESPFAYLAVTPRSRSENCSGLEQFCSNSSPVSKGHATPRQRRCSSDCPILCQSQNVFRESRHAIPILRIRKFSHATPFQFQRGMELQSNSNSSPPDPSNAIPTPRRKAPILPIPVEWRWNGVGLQSCRRWMSQPWYELYRPIHKPARAETVVVPL